jgi:hypothetical protein
MLIKFNAVIQIAQVGSEFVLTIIIRFDGNHFNFIKKWNFSANIKPINWGENQANLSFVDNREIQY